VKRTRGHATVTTYQAAAARLRSQGDEVYLLRRRRHDLCEIRKWRRGALTRRSRAASADSFRRVQAREWISGWWRNGQVKGTRPRRSATGICTSRRSRRRSRACLDDRQRSGSKGFLACIICTRPGHDAGTQTLVMPQPLPLACADIFYGESYYDTDMNRTLQWVELTEKQFHIPGRALDHAKLKDNSTNVFLLARNVSSRNDAFAPWVEKLLSRRDIAACSFPLQASHVDSGLQGLQQLDGILPFADQ